MNYFPIFRFKPARFISAVMLVAVLACVTSCSSDHGLEKKLDAVASNDSKLVVAFNIEQMFGQLEITDRDGHLELPEYFRTAINNFCAPRTRRQLNDIFDKAEGIGYDNCLLVVDGESVTNIAGMLVFTVTDESDFAKSMKAINPGVTTNPLKGYTDVKLNGADVLVKDNLGFLVFNTSGPVSGSTAADCIENFRKQAADHPLESWKKDALTSDASASTVMNNRWYTDLSGQLSPLGVQPANNSAWQQKYYDGYTVAHLKLDGQTVKTVTQCVDAGGATLSNPYAGNFDTGLMDYAGSADFVAFSLGMNGEGYKTMGEALDASFNNFVRTAGLDSSIPDFAQWKGLITKIANAPAEYLSDKGAFVSFGFKADATLAGAKYYSPDFYHVVIAASLQPEKVQAAFNDLCSQMEQLARSSGHGSFDRQGTNCTVSLPYDEDYDYLADKTVYNNVVIHMTIEGNTLVVSNAPISKNNGKTNFDKNIFESALFGAQIVANSETPIIKELGFKEGVDFSISARKETTDIVLTVTNTKQNFVPALFGLILGH